MSALIELQKDNDLNQSNCLKNDKKINPYIVLYHNQFLSNYICDDSKTDLLQVGRFLSNSNSAKNLTMLCSVLIYSLYAQ